MPLILNRYTTAGEMMGAKDFIYEMSEIPIRHFYIQGIYHGKKGCLRLAREIGCALADSPESETKKIYPEIYSQIIAKPHIQAHLMIPIDNDVLIRTIRNSETERRKELSKSITIQ